VGNNVDCIKMPTWKKGWLIKNVDSKKTLDWKKLNKGTKGWREKKHWIYKLENQNIFKFEIAFWNISLFWLLIETTYWYIPYWRQLFTQRSKWHHPGNPMLKFSTNFLSWFAFYPVECPGLVVNNDAYSMFFYYIQHYFQSMFFTNRHYVHSAFIIFNIISSQRFFSFNILSHSVFVTFILTGIFCWPLSHSTFCLSMFYIFGIFYFDICHWIFFWIPTVAYSAYLRSLL
jgi:hypothetical protein